MPALSPTMTQGNIGAWKKTIGDQLSPGDVLVEIETDKAQMDFECQEEGFLAQTFLKTGDKDVAVGTPLCILTENKADVDQFADFTVENIGGVTPKASAPASVAAPAATASSAPKVSGSNPADFPAHNLVGMPALSPTMTQGNIGTWNKKVGDKVSPGEALVAIETDKAQMDFECQEDGYIAKIFVEAGTRDVVVGTPICIIVEEKSDVEKFASFTLGFGGAAATEASVAQAAHVAIVSPAAAPAASHSGGRIIASPAAKFIAATKGISLENIVGTGPKGRIVKGDVLSFKGVPAASSTAPVALAARSSPAPFVAATETGQTYIDTPLSNIRKVIAGRLTDSKQSIPHYYLTIELNADSVLSLRETLNKQSNGKFKISVNDFVIKASSLALRDVPAVNSSWQGTFIREYQTSDIAVAVATETGLITPIVTGAESRGLSSISNTVKSLAEKARDGKLQPHEYQGGSFTISNLGMFGIQEFTAIINPPHSAILAVGGVSEKLVVDSANAKGFRAQKVFNVTLSCDHRVVDGAVGAKWLQSFKGYIENPLKMSMGNEYLEEHDLPIYISDILTRISHDKPINPAIYLLDNFDAISTGANVCFREFFYISCTRRNRLAFAEHASALLISATIHGDDLFSTNTDNSSNNNSRQYRPCDFHQILELMCPDFPGALVQRAAMAAAYGLGNAIIDFTCGDKSGLRVPVKSFVQYFKVCLCYYEFFDLVEKCIEASFEPVIKKSKQQQQSVATNITHHRCHTFFEASDMPQIRAEFSKQLDEGMLIFLKQSNIPLKKHTDLCINRMFGSVQEVAVDSAQQYVLLIQMEFLQN
ncbi:hypothetical protein HK100_001070, partial [Physocladia obscura]